MSLNSKALKIQKLFKPITNKNSGNIEDRIRYYLLIKKFLNIKENKNKCIGFYKLDKDGKIPSLTDDDLKNFEKRVKNVRFKIN